MKKAGIEGASLVAANNMQNYARANRRWKDDTGNARAGLHGGHFWENPEVLKVYIAHSMYYGIFLEMSNNRKFQILEESRDRFKDSWFNSVKRIMEQ